MRWVYILKCGIVRAFIRLTLSVPGEFHAAISTGTRRFTSEGLQEPLFWQSCATLVLTSRLS